MELLILIRPFFQLVNQYVGGFTYLFSLAFFVFMIRECIRGELRFARLEIIALSYFLISIGISFLAGSAVGTVISQYNKLFLCLIALMTAKRLSAFPLRGKLSILVRVSTYVLSLYVLIMLLVPGSYQVFWDVRTFQMVFSSQHEAAAFITLLIALVGYDLGRYKGGEIVRLMISSGLCIALLMTGARTITIVGCIIYCAQIIASSKRVDCRLRGFLFVIGVVVVILALPTLKTTALFEKSSSLGGGDSSFSNGRDIIWGYYTSMFNGLPIVSKVFGAGVGLIAEHSQLAVGAHNDFLSFMISYGVAGLILYVAYVIRSFVCYGAFPHSAVAIALFLWCAFFNGFAGYTELVFAICVYLATDFKGGIGSPRALESSRLPTGYH